MTCSFIKPPSGQEVRSGAPSWLKLLMEGPAGVLGTITGGARVPHCLICESFRPLQPEELPSGTCASANHTASSLHFPLYCVLSKSAPSPRASLCHIYLLVQTTEPDDPPCALPWHPAANVQHSVQLGLMEGLSLSLGIILVAENAASLLIMCTII